MLCIPLYKISEAYIRHSTVLSPWACDCSKGAWSQSLGQELGQVPENLKLHHFLGERISFSINVFLNDEVFLVIQGCFEYDHSFCKGASSKLIRHRKVALRILAGYKKWIFMDISMMIDVYFNENLTISLIPVKFLLAVNCWPLNFKTNSFLI